MKKLFLLFTLYFLLFTNLSAQDTFFRFISGNLGRKIYEYPTSYKTISISAHYAFSNYLDFEELSLTGDSITNWTYELDTCSSTETLYSQCYSDISDDYVYISGTIVGENSGRLYGFLSKFSSDLQTELWSKPYTLANQGNSFRVIKIKNDTSIILGSYNKHNDDLYTTFLETDTSGVIRWQKDFDCTGDCNMKPFHILPTEDNGFIFTCYQSHINGMPGTDEFRTAVIKTDSMGNEEWRETWGGDSTKNFGSWVVPLDDGNYLYAWTDYDYTGWNSQLNMDMTIRFAKFDIDGNVIWFKSLENQIVEIDYTISQMELMPDGNIIIAASSFIEGGLIKIDQDANLIWHRELMPPGLAYEDNTATQQQMKILGVTFTSDDGFILAGEYISSAGNMFPDGIQSAYAYKLDEYGCYDIGCSVGVEEEEITAIGFSIYPNPAFDFVVIKNISSQDKNCKIYNTQGQIVEQFQIHELETQISTKNWVKGIYFVQVGKQTKKLIVE